MSEIDGLARRRRRFVTECARLRDQVGPEVDDVAPNKNCADEEKARCDDERETIIMCLDPIHGHLILKDET